MNTLMNKPNFENMRLIVNAAENLHTAGDDKRSKEILADLGKNLVAENKA